MKIVLLAAIGLGVGVATGAGVGAVRVKSEILETRAQAAADSVALAASMDSHGESPIAAAGDDGAVTVQLPQETSDGSFHAEDTPGGGHEEPLAEDASPVEAADAEQNAPPDPMPPGAENGSTATPAATEGAQPGISPLNPEGAKKLSKIFGAMKAADAAAVLSEMTDEEVTAILQQMNDRIAGAIVGFLDPDRAAILGRALLLSSGGGA